MTVGLDLSAAPRFNDPNIAAIYLRAVQAGVSGWNVGGGIGVFNFVVGRDADIVIDFVTGTGTSGQLGWTFKQWDGAYATKGTRINLSADYFSAVLANAPLQNFENRLQEIVQHEAGHALFAGSADGGNQGHSLSSGNVMTNGGNGGTTLNQRDINTIREAYCRKL